MIQYPLREEVHSIGEYDLVYNKVSLEVAVYQGKYDRDMYAYLFTVNKLGCQYLTQEMRELVESVIIEHQGR
jgi:hypothetical protein